MKVYFIGTGPGAPDLITIRGAEVLARIRVVLYDDPVVPPAVLEHCRSSAEIINAVEFNLNQRIEHYTKANKLGYDVAYVHSGDLRSNNGPREQIERLAQLKINCEVVPGVI